MSPTSLALKEVVVVAKQNAAGESTSSIIGRQAIDHLQAMSLDDVMQLIPGHLMKNTDLTSRSNVQLRTLVNNNTNAFGSSIIMDGVPDVYKRQVHAYTPMPKAVLLIPFLLPVIKEKSTSQEKLSLKLPKIRSILSLYIPRTV